MEKITFAWRGKGALEKVTSFHPFKGKNEIFTSDIDEEKKEIFKRFPLEAHSTYIASDSNNLSVDCDL